MTKFDSQAFLNRLPNNEQSLRLQIRNSGSSPLIDNSRLAHTLEPIHSRLDVDPAVASSVFVTTCTDSIEHGRR